MNHTSFAIIPRLFISFDASAAFFVRSERKTFNVSQRPTRRYIATLYTPQINSFAIAFEMEICTQVCTHYLVTVFNEIATT